MHNQSSQPLYLKYRPGVLSGLVGQDIVARTLTNALQMGRVGHAYLFTGPRGCGKTSTARILAKSLNCRTNGTSAEPCGHCTNCTEISRGVSPDVIEIDAASHGHVDDAQQVIERCHLAPQTGPRKIYILDEVHMLSREAFNTLLKTIEEPPGTVTFILATTEEHKVPPTIASRCQRFSFRPVEGETLLESLRDIARKEGISIEEPALRTVAKLSQGGLRDALAMLDQLSILGKVGQDEVLALFAGISEDKLDVLLEALRDEQPQATLQQVRDLLGAGCDPLQIARNLLERSVEQTEAELLAGREARRAIEISEALLGVELSLRGANPSPVKLKSALLGICEGSGLQLRGRVAALERRLQESSKGEPAGPTQSSSQGAGREAPADSEEESRPPRAKNAPSPATQPNQDAAGGSLLTRLIERVTHQPTRQALKVAAPHVHLDIDEQAQKVTVRIARKNWYLTLSDSKKADTISKALRSELDKPHLEVVFRESSSNPAPANTPPPQQATPEQSTAIEQVAPAPPEPESSPQSPPPGQSSAASTENAPKDSESLAQAAEYVLGARFVNRKQP